ncbi:glycosyltransferase family 2 protein [Acinetobacter gandensis]|uniref:glycosyltransferase family 2 protein n=1 Tax=Acinetobacter gandensis TaxID=1443941 RepID=UPI003989662F
MLKVSYLIGLYNKENYIVECVNSILAENSYDIEIEVCIVDDGSTDNSYNLVIDNFKNNNFVKIYKFEENRGKNAAYNKAFNLSTGNYICIFGADDIVVPGRTKGMLQLSIKSNKAVYGGLLIKNSDLSMELDRKIPKLPNYYSISMFNFLSGGAGLIPKKDCEKIFPIPENLKFEDWWVSYFLIKHNNVSIYNDYVTIYRISQTNDCASLDETFLEYYETKLKDFSRHFDYIDEFLKKDNNPYLLKSKDIRNVIFGKRSARILYKELDKYTFMILFISLLGSKLFFKIIYLKKYFGNR